MSPGIVTSLIGAQTSYYIEKLLYFIIKIIEEMECAAGENFDDFQENLL